MTSMMHGMHAQVPGAKVFDDFGSSALGRWGRYAVYFTVRTCCSPLGQRERDALHGLRNSLMSVVQVWARCER